MLTTKRALQVLHHARCTDIIHPLALLGNVLPLVWIAGGAVFTPGHVALSRTGLPDVLPRRTEHIVLVILLSARLYGVAIINEGTQM